MPDPMPQEEPELDDAALEALRPKDAPVERPEADADLAEQVREQVREIDRAAQAAARGENRVVRAYARPVGPPSHDEMTRARAFREAARMMMFAVPQPVQAPENRREDAAPDDDGYLGIQHVGNMADVPEVTELAGAIENAIIQAIFAYPAIADRRPPWPSPLCRFLGDIRGNCRGLARKALRYYGIEPRVAAAPLEAERPVDVEADF